MLLKRHIYNDLYLAYERKLILTLKKTERHFLLTDFIKSDF